MASVRPQESLLLERGSLLVLYSDGLVERRHERFDDSLRRLAAAGPAVADLPVEEVCSTLMAKLGVDSSRDDDVAVMAMRFEAVPARVIIAGSQHAATELRQLRASMRGWLDGRAIGQPLQQTLLLAVGEACANAIEHAYGDTEPGDVQVDMTESNSGGFLVEVRDSGLFQPSIAREDRGRGTEIMRRLTADFSRESTADRHSGTLPRLVRRAFEHD